MKNLSIFNKSSEPAPLRQRHQQSISHCLRIADILMLHQDEDGCLQQTAMDERRPRRLGFTSLKVQCASPRRIVAGLLAALRKAKQQRTWLLNGKDERQYDEESSPTMISVDRLPGVDHDQLDLGSEAKESGHCRNDTSFNLGVGCGLLYLIASSKNELTKMVELRTEMELLLQNAKEELQMKNVFHEAQEKSHTIACTTTDIAEGPISSSQLSTSHCMPGSGSDVVNEQSMEHDSFRANNLEGMEELEAELESELECLQFQLDRESTFSNTQMIDNDTISNQNNLSSSEVIRTEEAEPEMDCGVCPVELERRLHELLETKQQERIRELESALECAEMKLVEKEIEVTWWKDTAKLMSRHVPQSSRLSTKIKLGIEQ